MAALGCPRAGIAFKNSISLANCQTICAMLIFSKKILPGLATFWISSFI
jgi:hypothetical protein